MAVLAEQPHLTPFTLADSQQMLKLNHGALPERETWARALGSGLPVVSICQVVLLLASPRAGQIRGYFQV